MFNHPYTSMNLNLFDDLINVRGDYLIQIILNIVLTIPFRFLIPYNINIIYLFKIMLFTFILSVTIN